jgi:hypothetical protein
MILSLSKSEKTRKQSAAQVNLENNIPKNLIKSKIKHIIRVTTMPIFQLTKKHINAIGEQSIDRTVSKIVIIFLLLDVTARV